MINEETYDYINDTEVLIFSDGDNIKSVKDFLKDYPSVRVTLDKDIYFYSAENMLHDTITKKYGLEYNLANSFMIYKNIILNLNLIDIISKLSGDISDNGTISEKSINLCNKYFKNLSRLNALGLELNDIGQKKINKLKKLLKENLNEDYKGYRYILTFDGEPQGIGMFQGLSEIDRDEEYIESLEDLFKELEIPEEVFIKNRFTTSYFTEKGLEKFKSAIDTLQQTYREYSGFDIELITEDIPEDKIVYQDEYQIIIKGIKEGENVFETLNKEIERYL